MMKFRNHTVSLSILSSESRVEATLNQMPVRPPYEEQGIRFETTGFMVSVYIEEIRSYVSLTPSNTLVITLAMEHFQNNTEGQCGECGGSSCLRPSGKRENDTCCAKTASDWIYPDPHKPYCASSHGNVPCDTLLPTPPPCKPPLHASDICEILRHPEFQPCGAVVNLDVLVHSCKSDVCLSGLSNMSCSVFAQAAEACKKAGFCVEWQHLTNGTCNIQCPGGMMYHECQGQLDDYCSGR
ncbi:intestinal mucin-like protein [Clupea harengus]|uniref:Intestinal mucin-like protein n=1 Tax=Clupea harengus TaxID=7950 RepID=A0A6P8GSY6_CLUHA|nr:intestinal mucin-like protein [Clupea harengus]